MRKRFSIEATDGGDFNVEVEGFTQSELVGNLELIKQRVIAGYLDELRSAETVAQFQLAERNRDGRSGGGAVEGQPDSA
jgi:hypothetical protein